MPPALGASVRALVLNQFRGAEYGEERPLIARSGIRIDRCVRELNHMLIPVVNGPGKGIGR